MAMQAMCWRGGDPAPPEGSEDPDHGGWRAMCDLRLRPGHREPAFSPRKSRLKSFSITSARGKSLAAYRDEAKKCVLVCANCHGEIESGVMPSPPPGTTYR
jgi:cytochrome c553